MISDAIKISKIFIQNIDKIKYFSIYFFIGLLIYSFFYIFKFNNFMPSLLTDDVIDF